MRNFSLLVDYSLSSLSELLIFYYALQSKSNSGGDKENKGSTDVINSVLSICVADISTHEKKSKGEKMGINKISKTDHKTTSKKSKDVPKTKCASKKNEGQKRSKTDRSRLMALQDALQDPLTGCEGL